MKPYCILMAIGAAMLAYAPASAGENGLTRGTSIVGMDGMSYFDLPPPGLYLLNYSGVSDSRRFVDDSGNDALPGANVNIAYNVARISLMTETDFLGADMAAFEVFPTYVRSKLQVNGQTIERTGLTDFAIDPFGLAWTIDNSRIGFSTTMVLPTASYDQNDPLNIGTNHATWIPQFFYTQVAPDRSSDVSVHLMYEHPFSNEEGHVNQVNPTGAEYASGDLVHGAVAYRQDIAENLSLGVSAIGAIQFEDDRIIGNATSNAFLQGQLEGYRYEKATIGVSLRYLVGGLMPVTLAYQRDVYARNTTETDSFMLKVGLQLKMF